MTASAVASVQWSASTRPSGAPAAAKARTSAQEGAGCGDAPQNVHIFVVRAVWLVPRARVRRAGRPVQHEGARGEPCSI
eukprot:2944792-Prymnesium_polylepis.1